MTEARPTAAAKSLLLVDVHERTRESRAKILRTMGVSVDCTDNAASALLLCETGTYNMVLIDFGSDPAAAENLSRRIKTAKPKQLIGILTNTPPYINTSRTAPLSKPRADTPAAPEAVSTTASSEFGERIRAAQADADNSTAADPTQEV